MQIGECYFLPGTAHFRLPHAPRALKRAQKETRQVLWQVRTRNSSAAGVLASTRAGLAPELNTFCQRAFSGAQKRVTTRPTLIRDLLRVFINN